MRYLSFLTLFVLLNTAYGLEFKKGAYEINTLIIRNGETIRERVDIVQCMDKGSIEGFGLAFVRASFQQCKAVSEKILGPATKERIAQCLDEQNNPVPINSTLTQTASGFEDNVRIDSSKEQRIVFQFTGRYKGACNSVMEAPKNEKFDLVVGLYDFQVTTKINDRVTKTSTQQACMTTGDALIQQYFNAMKAPCEAQVTQQSKDYIMIEAKNCGQDSEFKDLNFSSMSKEKSLSIMLIRPVIHEGRKTTEHTMKMGRLIGSCPAP